MQGLHWLSFPQVQGCPELFPGSACSPAASQTKLNTPVFLSSKKTLYKTHCSSELRPAIVDTDTVPFSLPSLSCAHSSPHQGVADPNPQGDASGARAPCTHSRGAGLTLLPFHCHARSWVTQTGLTKKNLKTCRYIKAISVTQDEAFVLFN